MEKTPNNDLCEGVKCANISTEGLKAELERHEDEMKRKEILDEYSIKQLPSGDWYTKIEGKKHQCKKKEDLEKYILEYDSQQEETISGIYDEYLKRRKTKVAETTWCLDISNYEAYIKTSKLCKIPLKQLKSKDGYDFFEHCKTPASNRKLILSPKTINLFSVIKDYNEKAGIPTSDNDYVFMRWLDGTLDNCTPMCFDSRLRRYCRKIGMIEKSPHDIRRTTLTNLYYLGMPLKDIQKFAGHTTLKQTMDYIRIKSLDEEAIPFLEEIATEITTE